MTEVFKINLDRTLMCLKIMSVVSGGLIACAAVYGQIDARLDRVEQAQQKFEGVIEERTRNMAENINRIYDIVKEKDRI